MNTEEFYKGFYGFVSNRKEERLETGTLLDNILKNGIPVGKITMLVGKSNTGSLIDQYVVNLINSKKK